ncbi:OmpA family protein [Alkalitalea saponilacus]|uniref:OmpA family protein n=1 Tax=Alkalitalea saponilacus TaxID=889453 RepID=A0A1T5HMW6_9BACT|nr:OmpA family protein [Alkalitalea saponilacus]ASB49378.1 hypothetical protein CDL62_09615 [Alkalitalea saponilacus]SKC21987.1 OmpA family protein [Alkalitalea saponilacus]
MKRKLVHHKKFKMNYPSFVVMLLLFVAISSISGQSKHHRRTVLNTTEKWEPGRIDDTRHVVDSFFYKNGTLKEVAESRIKRERFRVIDSIAVNKRKVWAKDGNLVLEENFKDGKRVLVNCYFPPYLNLIPNGSFEKHSEIPPHIIEKCFVNTVQCQPIDSVIRTELVHTHIKDIDTTKYTLITRETRSGCPLDFSRVVMQYVLVEKNGYVIDSIYANSLYSVHKEIYHRSKAHICNYEDIAIIVPGWKSLGRKFPNIYNVESNTPHSPLWGLADRVFYFNSIEGNSFIELSSGGGLANCNPFYNHPLLQTKLNSTMLKGDKYHLEFWLWKPYSYPVDYSLNISFSEHPVTLDNFQNYFHSLVNVESFHDIIVHQWQKVTLSFEAPEFARYMTIGFFNTLKEITPSIQRSSVLSRWCYVDGFILVAHDYKDKALPNFYPESSDFTETSTVDVPVMVFNHQKVEKDTPIVLENILFEVDSYNLLAESIPDLLELVSFMQQHPNRNIEVAGHTDDSGSDEYNKQLSVKRAKAVVQKLIELEIDAARLSWKGYGSTIPVSDNISEEGRSKNRRVEFMVL